MRILRQRHKSVISRIITLSGALLVLVASSIYAYAQISAGGSGLSPSGLTQPPFYPSVPPTANPADSIMMPFPVQQTVPANYENLMEEQFAADLQTPSNIKTVAEFDPATGFYVIRTKLGDTDITTPFLLTENNMKTGSCAGLYRNIIKNATNSLQKIKRNSRSTSST